MFGRQRKLITQLKKSYAELFLANSETMQRLNDCYLSYYGKQADVYAIYQFFYGQAVKSMPQFDASNIKYHINFHHLAKQDMFVFTIVHAKVMQQISKIINKDLKKYNRILLKNNNDISIIEQFILTELSLNLASMHSVPLFNFNSDRSVTVNKTIFSSWMHKIDTKKFFLGKARKLKTAETGLCYGALFSVIALAVLQLPHFAIARHISLSAAFASTVTVLVSIVIELHQFFKTPTL